MKKIYLFLMMALFANLSLFSQNIVFDDVNFKNALLTYYCYRIDTNSDGEISVEEAENVKGLYGYLKAIKI